jgi:hypothetical protein
LKHVGPFRSAADQRESEANTNDKGEAFHGGFRSGG